MTCTIHNDKCRGLCSKYEPRTYNQPNIDARNCINYSFDAPLIKKKIPVDDY